MEEAGTKSPHAPAMDVVAPHRPAPEHIAVQPAPPVEATGHKPALVEVHKEKPSKPAKKPSNGVGIAIFATMVIVLGLAAMATYAYIKTQN